MARARNIKPGFFTNDAMAELPALTRLLFIGLWTLVDRAGRIEDRPKKIKAECMPYDDLDADAALDALACAGFLHRYEVGGIKCIQVVNWDKHQNPHMKEQASTIPPHPEHQASTGQAPDKQRPFTELAGLIPDSGFLIPDSLQHTHTAGAWLPKSWGLWAMKTYPHWDVAETLTIAGQFADHQKAKDGTSSDWPASWRSWCSDPLTQKAHPPPKPAVPVKAPPITVPSRDRGAEEYFARMAARDAQIEAERKAKAAA